MFFNCGGKRKDQRAVGQVDSATNYIFIFIFWCCGWVKSSVQLLQSHLSNWSVISVRWNNMDGLWISGKILKLIKNLFGKYKQCFGLSSWTSVLFFSRVLTSLFCVIWLQLSSTCRCVQLSACGLNTRSYLRSCFCRHKVFHLHTAHLWI